MSIGTGVARVIGRMRGGQAAVKSLEANGVETVFGIPGVHTLEIYDALIDSSISHVLARHEQGAGFMADGYARASGRPGVAVIITGPGITNVATSVGEAYTDSVPLLILSSNVERQWVDRMLGHLHDLEDQLAVMRAVTKWNARARSVDDISTLLATAFEQMTHGRPRPTHVEVPLDVLSDFAETEIQAATSLVNPAPPSEVIAQAADAITNASKVVIYCGGGSISSNAGPEITSLSEYLRAPVLTSIMGKGIVSDRNPYMLGHLWDRENPVDGLLREADLAIVFGSKLGAQETDYQRMPLPEKLIRVDVDANEVTRNYRPWLPVVADVATSASLLLERLQSNGTHASGWSKDQIQETKRSTLESAWGAAQRPYVEALRAAIPDDGILVNDMTMMSYVNCTRYPVYKPRTFFFPAGYGTLGYSLPAAIGAKIACPDKSVVAVMGDGGFQYTMQELATAVQFEVGVPIVIFNDSAYTAVKEAQATEHDRRFIAVDLVNPHFLMLAAAYDIPAVRAESPGELEQAVRDASARKGPTLIDTPIHIGF